MSGKMLNIIQRVDKLVFRERKQRAFMLMLTRSMVLTIASFDALRKIATALRASIVEN